MMNIMYKQINKKSKIYFIATALIVLFSSCSTDILDKRPFNTTDSASFYSNEQEMTQAVNGIYPGLYDAFGSTSAWAMGEMRSDNTNFIFNPSDRGGAGLEQVSEFLNIAANVTTDDKYFSNYQIINDANQVLSRIDNTDIEFASNNREDLKGQALFLRTLAYFDLVKYYGGVPLYLTAVSNFEDAFIARSSKEEVYNQIVSDAQESINLLPTTQSEAGRATKGAAQMLLGDVYLNLKRYGDAEGMFSQVSGYTLMSDYAEVFSVKNNSESIFELQYAQGGEFTNDFFYRFLPVLDNTAVVTGIDDGRFNGGRSGFNTATPNLINSYEVGDERLDASIGYVAASEVSGGTYSVTSFPYIKKYLIPHNIFGDVGVNWPVYRYAETLLSLAESLNEQSKSAEALTPLNLVRDRAGLIAITTTDQSELRTIIAHERQVELAFENKRWIDLVRTDQAINVLTAYGALVNANPGDYYFSTGDTPVGGSYIINEDKYIFPIPQSEIDANSALTQNNGYN